MSKKAPCVSLSACLADLSEDDIVQDAARIALEIWPDLSPPDVQRFIDQFYARWEGDRVTVSRRSDLRRRARDEAILRDYRAGERVALLSRRYELTERRIIQILQAAVAA